MSSIIKVEKRRAQALEQVKGCAVPQLKKKQRLSVSSLLQEVEISETSQLIDRYRFLELFPCSMDELKILGYQKLRGKSSTASLYLSQTNAAAANASSDEPQTSGMKEANAESMARPDVSQMVPFKVLKPVLNHQLSLP